MKAIPNAYNKVPMMFRAQVKGRSQLHYLDAEKKKASNKQDVELWAEEWIEKAELIPVEVAQDTPNYQTRDYRINWRFVTNGGQDDGTIRPIIGAYGIPFYPGSSMKGAFRQACELAERAGELSHGSCADYCGDESDITQGMLRFEGAYPINDWTKNLVDLVHPQSEWQVKTYETNTKPKGESAFAQVSLYKPTLRFTISSIKLLSPEQWQEIWRVWERALATGLGSRVSAGYGQIETTLNSNQILYQASLKGQGQAPKLIDDIGEFRPNIYRAALRGHALRIFGGLTDAETAEQLVEELFGSIRCKNIKALRIHALRIFSRLTQRITAEQLVTRLFDNTDNHQNRSVLRRDTWQILNELVDVNIAKQSINEMFADNTVGLLNLQFKVSSLVPGTFGQSGYEQPTYNVEGDVIWSLTRPFQNEEQTAVLQKLITDLMWFAMVLGGFGKSWRRADHRLFYENGEYEKLIGCHWQWTEGCDRKALLRVWKPSKVGEFIDSILETAKEWMQWRGVIPSPDSYADWREAWHPSNVQVWGRVAENKDDCRAIFWLHEPYEKAISRSERDKTIKATSVTGKIQGKTSQIGCLWHRMYPPKVKLVQTNPQGKPKLKPTNRYLELLTIFPDGSNESQEFIKFLNTKPDGFEQLWGGK